MRTYVLDARALLALFNRERGAEEVAKILRAARTGRCTVMIHRLTPLEVFTEVRRSTGEEEAQKVLTIPQSLPVEISDDLSPNMFHAASDFKMSHRMSFADSFVLALAEVRGAEVVTSDHHEFDSVESTGVLKFKWIR